MEKGKLYLIPVPLAEGAEKRSYTILHDDIINRVQEYVVENEKTARKFLKVAGIKTPQSQLVIHDYGKHSRGQMDYNQLFANVMKGQDLGLMSEAGCPGVADPGSDIVLEAHRRNVQVVPLVGPSSILLALMSSGFNGQKFTFHGYLPIDKGDRGRKIKELESQSVRERMTQVFIETPFRNNQLFNELLRVCKPHTKLCVASNLTSSEENIYTTTVEKWKERKVDLHKIPAIFLLFG